ncbi:MAG: hypothetical protein ABIV39_11070, partial [Verrucomicrobiota bacterium]
MKAAFNQLAKIYFFSPWLPSVFALAVFGLLFVNELKLHIQFISLVLLLVFIGSVLGVLAAGIVQLIKGRKLWGTINLMALPVIGLIAFLGIGFIALEGLFSDEPDNFGKNIIIPADMNVSDPVENFEEPGEPAIDQLTENIVAAFTTSGVSNGNPSVSTDLTILNEFATTNRQKLIQYLSASPRWFVTEERGKPYAYRRLVIGGRWQNTLNGFYSSSSVAPSSEPNFQIRIVIGFDGSVFAEPFRKIATTTQVGFGVAPIRVVDDKAANQGKESYFVLRSARASVEIFEQSRLNARPATQLALAEIKHELETALISTNLIALSPQPALESSEPAIQLAKGM